jgi:hypothetical protein
MTFQDAALPARDWTSYAGKSAADTNHLSDDERPLLRSAQR